MKLQQGRSQWWGSRGLSPPTADEPLEPPLSPPWKFLPLEGGRRGWTQGTKVEDEISSVQPPLKYFLDLSLSCRLHRLTERVARFQWKKNNSMAGVTGGLKLKINNLTTSSNIHHKSDPNPTKSCCYVSAWTFTKPHPHVLTFFFSNTQENYISLYIKKKKRGVKPPKYKNNKHHTHHTSLRNLLLAYYIKKDLTSTKKERVLVCTWH
jgi:hypothetical protein